MTDWCEPIRAALAQRTTPCRLFFRDDDGGWGDQRLYAMLDRFSAAVVPIDLALIPAALSAELVAELSRRIAAGDAIGLHQHGYTHTNHELSGRKCEFGPARSLVEQHIDIKAGRALLREAFDTLVTPIFTPPWNRCTPDTASCLEALGFRALSRDLGAQPLPGARMAEIPVGVDWCKLRPRGGGAQPLAEHIAALIGRESMFGIMLHHAVMDDEDMELLDDLFRLLRAFERVQCVPMRQLLPGADEDLAHLGGAGAWVVRRLQSEGMA